MKMVSRLQIESDLENSSRTGDCFPETGLVVGTVLPQIDLTSTPPPVPRLLHFEEINRG